MSDPVVSSRPASGAAAVGLTFSVVLATHWLHGGLLERAGLVSSAMSATMLALAPVVLAMLAVVGLTGAGMIASRGSHMDARPGRSSDARAAAWDVAFVALVASLVLDCLYVLDGAVLHAAPLALALAGAAVVQACGAAAAYLACRQIRVLLHRLASRTRVTPADRTSGAPEQTSRPLVTLWTGLPAGSRAPPSITSFA
ncbi:hypothetical protein [Promicromonospora sp. NPDC050880]|uniref:hypothetical protein n=1 Tax=Promicromonospora sp. NPDC050880 TaxID=3364406 RepID=UPI00378CC13F